MEREIDLVLADYAAECEAGRRPQLADWLARFPHCSEELQRFALYSDVVGVREPMVQDDPVREAQFIERAVRVAERIRAAETVAASKPIVSLKVEAESRGVTFARLAERLGLPLSFVARLEQRLFVPASVPRSLLDRMADTVGRTVEDVRAYLSLPPRLATAGDFKSKEAPRVPDQVDFRDTVRSALDLTEAQKAAWLRETDA